MDGGTSLDDCCCATLTKVNKEGSIDDDFAEEDAVDGKSNTDGSRGVTDGLSQMSTCSSGVMPLDAEKGLNADDDDMLAARSTSL
jgi:hypothetical protein